MAFTINGQLFLTDIAAGVTRGIAIDEPEFKPVLNPRISPDGRHIMYTTGTYLVDVDLADVSDTTDAAEDAGDAVSIVASVPQDDADDVADTQDGTQDDAQSDAAESQAGEWKIGLAEFAAGEEMDRYDASGGRLIPSMCSSKPSTHPTSRPGTSLTRPIRRNPRRPAAIRRR